MGSGRVSCLPLVTAFGRGYGDSVNIDGQVTIIVIYCYRSAVVFGPKLSIFWGKRGLLVGALFQNQACFRVCMYIASSEYRCSCIMAVLMASYNYVGVGVDGSLWLLDSS